MMKITRMKKNAVKKRFEKSQDKSRGAFAGTYREPPGIGHKMVLDTKRMTTVKKEVEKRGKNKGKIRERQREKYKEERDTDMLLDTYCRRTKNSRGKSQSPPEKMGTCTGHKNVAL